MSLYLLLMSYIRAFLGLFLLFLFVLASPVLADAKPVINEFLAHPGSDNKEWVELYMPDGVDITNYWIDDDTDFASDTGNSSKKQITNVVAGSDSHYVVFELSSSMFNNDGDTLALFTPDGTLVDNYTYTKDPGVDITLGRTPDVTGDFQILDAATKGSPNSPPKPTDTPTPAPTQKLAPTDKPPKPTETPKPPKPLATLTKVVNDTTVLANTSTVAKTITSFIPSESASSDAEPTSILGASTKSAEKKFTKVPKQAVLVKASTSTAPKVLAVIIGGLLLLGCGILLYLKKQGIWPWKREK